MALQDPQPEPSMEEILASIRRIISEDEEEPAAKAAEAPRPAPPAPARIEPPRQIAAAPSRPPAPQRAAPPARDAAVHEDDRASRRLATEDVEMIKKNAAEAFAENEDAIIDATTAAAASSAVRSRNS